MATVEAVLVVPLVLVPVLLGVVIFGQLEHTRLVVDAAAAAGARQAAVVGEDSATVRERIATELRDGGIDPARATGHRRAGGRRLGRADPGHRVDRRPGLDPVPRHLAGPAARASS